MFTQEKIIIDLNFAPLPYQIVSSGTHVQITGQSSGESLRMQILEKEADGIPQLKKRKIDSLISIQCTQDATIIFRLPSHYI